MMVFSCLRIFQKDFSKSKFALKMVATRPFNSKISGGDYKVQTSVIDWSSSKKVNS